MLWISRLSQPKKETLMKIYHWADKSLVGGTVNSIYATMSAESFLMHLSTC